MVGKAVLHHGQHIEGRIREILKPLTTPVHCTGRKGNKRNAIGTTSVVSMQNGSNLEFFFLFTPSNKIYSLIESPICLYRKARHEGLRILTEDGG